MIHTVREQKQKKNISMTVQESCRLCCAIIIIGIML